MERIRSISLENMSPEEADSVSEQIGSKVRQICDEAIEKANILLKIYGMEAKMQIVFKELGGFEPKSPKKPRARKSNKRL